MMGLSKKVILLGHFGVGKTSLIQRFVHQKFSEKYLTTIGVKIDKKVITVEGRELSMLIWDIAGESTQQKVPESYKLGAHGAIYVFDLTRPSSYDLIEQEVSHLKNILPPIPFVLVGNKRDLLTEEEFNALQKKLPAYDYIFSSAKTGEGVEEMFFYLAKQMLQ